MTLPATRRAGQIPDQESTRQGSTVRRDDSTCDRTEWRKRVSPTDAPEPKGIGTPAVEQSQWGQGFLAREPVTHAFWVLFCQCVWAAVT